MQLYANLTWMTAKAKQKFREFLLEESGEVNIVAMIILIAIAVMLALLFKDQIGNLVEQLFQSVSDSTSGLTENYDSGPIQGIG